MVSHKRDYDYKKRKSNLGTVELGDTPQLELEIEAQKAARSWREKLYCVR